jgi:hypothetical protein
MTDPRLDDLLRWLAREIAPFLPPAQPKQLTAILVREEENMLVYDVPFPPTQDPDVMTRRLSTSVDGTVTDQDYAGDALKGQIKVPAGSAIIVSLRDIDDAVPPNESKPSDPYSFIAKDTLPPATPGQLSVELISEEEDEPQINPLPA